MLSVVGQWHYDVREGHMVMQILEVRKRVASMPVTGASKILISGYNYTILEDQQNQHHNRHATYGILSASEEAGKHPA